MASRILNVPYRSQHSLDAFLQCDDAVSACVAMVLGGLTKPISIGALSAWNRECPRQATGCGRAVQLMGKLGVDTHIQTGCTLADLKDLIDKGQPAIARIKYDKILYRWDKVSTGEHFVVVVGYDDDNSRMIINDPDYPLGAAGYQRPYSYKVFLNAWGGFDPSCESNHCLIIPRLTQPLNGSAVRAEAADPSLSNIASERWVVEPRGLALRVAADFKAAQIGELIYGQPVSALGCASHPDHLGCIWQIVQTELGITGVAVVGYGQERYLADSRPAGPYLVQVMDTLAVREVHGLSLRPQRNIFLPPVDRATIGEKLVVYSRLMETDGQAWLLVQSSRMMFGWVRENVNGTSLVKAIGLHGKGDTADTIHINTEGLNWAVDSVIDKEQELLLSADSI